MDWNGCIGAIDLGTKVLATEYYRAGRGRERPWQRSYDRRQPSKLANSRRDSYRPDLQVCFVAAAAG